MALSGLVSASPAAIDVTTVAMTTVTVYLPPNNSAVVFTDTSAPAATSASPVEASVVSPAAEPSNHTITVGSSVPVVTPVITASVITMDDFTYTEADISTLSNVSYPVTYITVAPSGGNLTTPAGNGTYTLTVPAPTTTTSDGNGANGKGDSANPGSSSKNAGAVETGYPVQRQAAGLAVAFLLPMLAF
ncbi:hypothetical protein P8C59_000854 [Phyllachora maydis]|uniref:Uncharacterized protein n=1 Tax=Phyllachora maydis TaxID=1825666 RepID=A0AAD9HY46_9PEZI|nr:hypothetical protein P8C59_000854 [Phyllachora maydis]